MDWAVEEDGSVRYDTALLKTDKLGHSYFSGYKLLCDEQGFFIAAYENMARSEYYALDLDNAEIVWKVPLSELLTGCEEFITDGEWLYCIQDQKRVLRTSLLTGQTDVLFEGESIPTDLECNLQLFGRDLLFFVCRTGEYAGIYRLYLPTMTLDLLYDQVLAEDLTDDFSTTISDNSNVSWRVLNPEFKAELQRVLSDPDSKYKEVVFGEGLAMWEATDLKTIMANPDFVWLAEQIENDTKIPGRMAYYSSNGKTSASPRFYDNELNRSELGIYVDVWD